MKIVIVSGGFDPIHSGHISYFNAAAELGDKLIVALNSDDWLVNKKGKFFMPFNERKNIIENLKQVDAVIDFEDDDHGSAINALLKVKQIYPDDIVIFANGGDRNKENIPEMSVSGIDFKFSVGGDDKKNSSSWILKKWEYYFEERLWGSFYNLFEDNTAPVISAQTKQDGFYANISGTITDDVKLAEVLIDNKLITPKSDGSFNTKLYVPRNGLEVKILAFDMKGNKSSKTLQVERGAIEEATGQYLHH